jgi:dTMP kinase
MLESFIKYQGLMAKEFKRMQKRYGIISINGNRAVNEISIDLQRRVDKYLLSGQLAY